MKKLSAFHDMVFQLAKDDPTSLVPEAEDARTGSEDDSFSAYQLMHHIIENLPDATFIVDKEKKVVFWNRAIEELTGVKREEIIGKGNYAYALPFYGDCRQILIDLIDRDEVTLEQYNFIKRMGNTLFAETFLPDLNGRGRHVWATATPLCDKQGNRVGGIESIRDITEYKQFEEQKAKLEAELHHSRMMEKFLIQLGHDLNTPLTPLFVMLPLIKARITDANIERMLDICIKSAENIHGLTQKALKLARLSSSSAHVVRDNMNLAPAVSGYLAEFSESAAQRRISIRNTIDPEIAVRVAPDQLKELFVNLISNAVTFSRQCGVITIGAEQQNEVVTVSVQDDGTGIESGNLEHIFEEFFKSDESRHDLNKSGLGLAICKKIVSNHNGRIWAESRGRDQGTTIRFTLPVATSPIPPVPAIPSP